jgi:hypothetical protein
MARAWSRSGRSGRGDNSGSSVTGATSEELAEATTITVSTARDESRHDETEQELQHHNDRSRPYASPTYDDTNIFEPSYEHDDWRRYRPHR